MCFANHDRMSCLAPFLLPTEIVALFVTYADSDTLPAVSLVSYLFHQLAFPLVHYSISFKQTSRIKEFITIVQGEDEIALLRISQAVRCLTFASELDKSIDEDLIIKFRTIIPKLIQLESLTWGVEKYNGPTALFSDFQRWCSRLWSIQMSVTSGPRRYLGVVLALFN
jgi:hypothetical protein